MAFITWRKCLSEPKQLLKLVVLILCICLASYQLFECFKKILHPPISTYYSFHLNESMAYPAVTICRNPGYKTELFWKYGFTDTTVSFSSVWRDFNYSAHTLSEFFEEATYTVDETMAIIAFEGFDRTNVDIEEIFLLNYGRCFTIKAKIQSRTFSEFGGYKFYFQHTDTIKLRNFFGISLSGYHIFIHDNSEVLTATEQQDLSYMEYLYLEAGEDLRVNLRVQKYNQINAHDFQCSTGEDYSYSKCHEQCLFKQILNVVNCTAPWVRLPDVDKPECDSYQSLRLLLLYYTDSYRERYLQPCECLTKCNISVYNTFVQSRKEVTMPDSNMSLYFSSNLISVMDEVFGYDWNAFLADMGGSLGFLLGLSVIGIISILEQIVLIIYNKRYDKEDKDKSESENKEDEINNKKSGEKDVPKIKIDMEENGKNVNDKNRGGHRFYEKGDVNIEKNDIDPYQKF